MSLTSSNISNVRDQIFYKLDYTTPFYSTPDMILNTIQDQDHFPYTRYFRGQYSNDKPTVYEREAGWRPRYDGCYRKQYFHEKDYSPAHCFEAPCSVVYPCLTPYIKAYKDKEELDVFLNKMCINKSP